MVQILNFRDPTFRKAPQSTISKLVQTGSDQMEVTGPDGGGYDQIFSSPTRVHQIFSDDSVDPKNISCSRPATWQPLSFTSHTMSNNPNDHSDACHRCPTMAAIISHAVAHATEQELRSNKNYTQLKKDLERQVILTAEYRYVQISTIISNFYSTYSQSRSYFSIIELLGADIFKLVADQARGRLGDEEQEPTACIMYNICYEPTFCLFNAGAESK